MKLAIISSYKENCGIAAYTEILESEFRKKVDVDILKLETSILRGREKNIVKLADEHIREIAKKAKEYDWVNIQFEMSLFGFDVDSAFRRFLIIANSCDNLLVTFHSINLQLPTFSINYILNRHPISHLRGYRAARKMGKFYANIINLLKKKNAAILVHTKRDAKNICNIFNYDRVYDYPLTMLKGEEKNRNVTEETKLEYKRKVGVKPEDKIIGLFGFVSEYKGHMTAIKALSVLPDEYKLVIWGGQHPSGIQMYQMDNYLNGLLEYIERQDEAKYKAKESYKFTKNNSSLLRNRVIFMGHCSDSEFLDAMYYSDYVVIPYLEVGQSGSAVAQQAIETKANAIMSNNKLFGELSKYFPDCFPMCDIGNYLELAHKILNYKNIYKENIDKCMEMYNLTNNILNYIKIFEEERVKNND